MFTREQLLTEGENEGEIKLKHQHICNFQWRLMKGVLVGRPFWKTKGRPPPLEN